MATKADFTADEWKQIQRAPFVSGLAGVAASPSGPFWVGKEMFAVGKMLGEVKTDGSSNELIKALVADIEAGARDLSAPAELKGKTPDQVKSYGIESVRQVAALVEKKAKPEEAQGFKQWLVAVAQKVAEAAKEGGFLGFGGTQVSEQEAATVKELSTALGGGKVSIRLIGVRHRAANTTRRSDKESCRKRRTGEARQKGDCYGSQSN